MSWSHVRVELVNGSSSGQVSEFLVYVVSSGATVVAAENTKIFDDMRFQLVYLNNRQDLSGGRLDLLKFTHEVPKPRFGMDFGRCEQLHSEDLRRRFIWGGLSSGEILSVVEIFEVTPHVVKNFGVLCRYNSRTGTHNVYKEFRDLTRTGAVDQLYADMASRHRARYRSIQIIDVKTVKPKQVTRPNIIQFLNPRLRFPLPHRVKRTPVAQYKKKFAFATATTFQH